VTLLLQIQATVTASLALLNRHLLSNNSPGGSIAEPRQLTLNAPGARHIIEACLPAGNERQITGTAKKEQQKQGTIIMIVYGVALLSACLILGMLIGEALGVMLGVEANVGGVGIAMLFLVLASNSRQFKALTEGAAGDGIKFWSAMYIPIVVAMAARQNVAAAVDGGLLALLAGVAAVVVSFALVPVLSKIGKPKPVDQPQDGGPA
jgi:malonate transporter MadL subunit